MMVKCIDCFHFQVCTEYRTAFWGHKAQIDSKIINADPSICPYFIARSQLINLPCKTGDKIYFAKKRNYEYATITDVFVRREDTYFTWRAIYYDYDREFRTVEFVETGTFIQSDIGRTIFFTPEEAEQALKERDD